MDSKQDLTDFAKVEPEAEAEAIIPTQQTVGEPLPEWHSAIPTWGFAWHFYQYGFGVAFGILALLTITFLLRNLKLNRAARPKKATLIVLILLFLFGSSRCLYLSVDAYNTKRIFLTALSNILWSLGNPCIITAYALIFLVLKNIFFLKERFQRWYTVRNIALGTVPYFTFAFVSELVVLYIPRFNGLIFACQLLYVVLSLMLSTFYSFIAYLLWKNYKGKNLHRGKESKHQIAWAVKNRVRGRRTLSILKTCIGVILGGVTLCALQIYSMSGVYGPFSKATYVKAWPWLIFNYSMRVLELFLAFVLYVASTKYKQDSGSHQTSISVSLECSEVKPAAGSRIISRLFPLTRRPLNVVAHAVYS